MRITNPAELLSRNGLKQTKQRLIVLDKLSEAGSAVSQPDLEKQLGAEMDRVTLYRILGTFEEKGIVHSVLDLNGTNNYALCKASCSGGAHHDEHLHFNCTNCDRIYCLPTHTPNVNLPEGFRSTHIHVTAVGVCDNCSKELSLV